jgi:hypothetical protein
MVIRPDRDRDRRRMSDFIDRPKEIRQGEELDVGRLTAFLKSQCPSSPASRT